MTISSHSEKAFDKIQPSFIIKKKKHPIHRTRRKLPRMIKNIYGKPRANLMLNGEELKTVS